MAMTCDTCGKQLADDSRRIVVCMARGREYPDDWTPIADVCLACWFAGVGLKPVKVTPQLVPRAIS